ncbi:MAG: hypothetical protein U0Q15_02790 [Kineosporiaceae bacterium]
MSGPLRRRAWRVLVPAVVAALAAGGSAVLTAAPASAADVLVRGVHVSGAARSFTLAEGQDLRVLVTAVAGQTVTARITGGTFAGCAARASVLDPAGKALTAPVCAGRSATLTPVVVRGSGLFAVSLDVDDDAAGSVTVAVTGTGPATITPNVPALTVTVPARGHVDLATRAEAGEFLRAVHGRATPVNDPVTLALLRPDGSTLAQGQGARAVATVSGIHRVRVGNPGGTALQVPVTLSKGRDVTGTITPGGPAVDVSVTVPGQQVRLTFPATAGQRVVGVVRDAVIRGDGANPATGTLSVAGVVYGELSLREDSASDGLVPTTGTQTLTVALPDTGHLRLALTLVTPPAPVALVPGRPVTVTSAAWTDQTLEFRARRGQVYRLSVTTTLGRGSVRWVAPDDPTGRELLLIERDGGTYADTSDQTFPDSGTYRLVVDPRRDATGTTTVTLDVRRDDGIVLGEPKDVTMVATPYGFYGYAVPVTDLTPGQVLRYRVTGNGVGPVELTLRCRDSAVTSTVALPAGDSAGAFAAMPGGGACSVTVYPAGKQGTLTLTLS